MKKSVTPIPSTARRWCAPWREVRVGISAQAGRTVSQFNSGRLEFTPDQFSRLSAEYTRVLRNASETKELVPVGSGLTSPRSPNLSIRSLSPDVTIKQEFTNTCCDITVQ